MLIIPEGVSPRLVDELEKFQKQIRILIRNHQVKKVPLSITMLDNIYAIFKWLPFVANVMWPFAAAQLFCSKLINVS